MFGDDFYSDCAGVSWGASARDASLALSIKGTKGIMKIKLFKAALQGGPNTVFFSLDDEDSVWGRQYRDQLLSSAGFGTKCISR